MSRNNTFKSDLSGLEFPDAEKVEGYLIRNPLLNYIQQEFPLFNANGVLAISELNNFREKFVLNTLIKDTGELNELERKVIESINSQSYLSEKIENKEQEELTTGQRMADKVAAFGGSWKFISAFGIFLFAWIGINLLWLNNKGFDPYPFILLNLILSCIAAIQAPIIMMSQNRQEEKDRERSKKDYMINLKSELEIRMLHEKIDHLLLHQQQEFLEIQKIQIDMMNDILKKLEEHSAKSD